MTKPSIHIIYTDENGALFTSLMRLNNPLCKADEPAMREMIAAVGDFLRHVQGVEKKKRRAKA